MTPRLRRLRLLAAVLVALAGLAVSCDAVTPTPVPHPSPVPSLPDDATPTPVPPRPDAGACYPLRAQQALAPTSSVAKVRCGRSHTSETFHVGTLDTVVDGHLVAVDSDRVARQLARTCPRRLPAFVGADARALRLSMLRAVWFAPTVEESDAGANWFRCDVVALAGDGELLGVRGSLAGVLDDPAGRDRYGICATSRPGAANFARVACAQEHTWRAVASYDVPGRRLPGDDVFSTRATEVCRALVEEQSENPLDFEWGFDRPTDAQWRDGQRWGLCWMPA